MAKYDLNFYGAPAVYGTDVSSPYAVPMLQAHSRRRGEVQLFWSPPIVAAVPGIGTLADATHAWQEYRILRNTWGPSRTELDGVEVYSSNRPKTYLPHGSWTWTTGSGIVTSTAIGAVLTPNTRSSAATWVARITGNDDLPLGSVWRAALRVRLVSGTPNGTLQAEVGIGATTTTVGTQTDTVTVPIPLDGSWVMVGGAPKVVDTTWDHAYVSIVTGGTAQVTVEVADLEMTNETILIAPDSGGISTFDYGVAEGPVYYSMWIRGVREHTGDEIWFFGAATGVEVVADCGYADRLWRLLPGLLRGEIIISDEESGVLLKKFLDLFAFEFDSIRGNYERLRRPYWINGVPNNWLPVLSQQFALPYFGELSPETQAGFVQRAGDIHRYKGTPLGIEALVAGMTEYGLRIDPPKNLFHDEVMSSFEYGIGTWARVTSNVSVGFMEETPTVQAVVGAKTPRCVMRLVASDTTAAQVASIPSFLSAGLVWTYDTLALEQPTYTSTAAAYTTYVDLSTHHLAPAALTASFDARYIGVRVDQGTTYTVSAWVRPLTTAGTCTLSVIMTPELGSTAIESTAAIAIPANTWTQISYSPSIGSRNSKYWMGILLSFTGAREYYVDGVQVELGPVATSFESANQVNLVLLPAAMNLVKNPRMIGVSGLDGDGWFPLLPATDTTAGTSFSVPVADADVRARMDVVMDLDGACLIEYLDGDGDWVTGEAIFGLGSEVRLTLSPTPTTGGSVRLSAPKTETGRFRRLAVVASDNTTYAYPYFDGNMASSTSDYMWDSAAPGAVMANNTGQGWRWTTGTGTQPRNAGNTGALVTPATRTTSSTYGCRYDATGILTPGTAYLGTFRARLVSGTPNGSLTAAVGANTQFGIIQYPIPLDGSWITVSGLVTISDTTYNHATVRVATGGTTQITVEAEDPVFHAVASAMDNSRTLYYPQRSIRYKLLRQNLPDYLPMGIEYHAYFGT